MIVTHIVFMIYMKGEHGDDGEAGLPGKAGSRGKTGVPGLPGEQGSIGPKVKGKCKMLYNQFRLMKHQKVEKLSSNTSD